MHADIAFPVPRPDRRHPRLDPTAYAQAGAICSVTLCTAGRVRIFADAARATAAVEALKTHAAETRVPVYAYCVMPDHVHLVLGPSPTCDIVAFVGQVKNLVQRAVWRLGVEGRFWQRSFWDHFLRQDEDVEIAVRYVLNNPVRAGLVREWREYPFSGSLVFSL